MIAEPTKVEIILNMLYLFFTIEHHLIIIFRIFKGLHKKM